MCCCLFQSCKWSLAPGMSTAGRVRGLSHGCAGFQLGEVEVFGFNRGSQLQSLVYAEITGQSCKVKFNLLFYRNCACCVI